MYCRREKHPFDIHRNQISEKKPNEIGHETATSLQTQEKTQAQTWNKYLQHYLYLDLQDLNIHWNTLTGICLYEWQGKTRKTEFYHQILKIESIRKALAPE
jgi:hypothetical protein